MSRAHILMFGATGQTARCVLDRARETGAAVTALPRETADLTRPETLRAALADAPEGAVVVNAAAYTAVDKAESEPDLAAAINADAPGVIAEAAAARGMPLIHLSTDYVFDGEKAEPYLEDDAPAPQSVYGRTKRAGEVAALDANPMTAIVRTAWVYSPYGGNFVKTMLRVGAERDELRVVDDQHGAPTSAHDIADGLLTMAGAMARGEGAYGVFHLTGGGEASWADLAEAVFDLQAPVWGRRPEVTRITTADYPTPARRPANSRLSCEALARAYGYRAPHWREALPPVVARLNAA